MSTWKPFAEQITDNLHLNKVLLSVPTKRRQEFYEAIKPFLKFEPKPKFSFAASPSGIRIGTRPDGEPVLIPAKDSVI